MDDGEDTETSGQIADIMAAQMWGGNIRYISDILVSGRHWTFDRITNDLRQN